VNPPTDRLWPIYVADRRGYSIYLTRERWDHALGHPGMSHDLLEVLLETIRSGRRRQDAYTTDKVIYTLESFDLPDPYTHMVAIVKMGWRYRTTEASNNFVLTSYLIQKW
jgi:hypothetical protein